MVSITNINQPSFQLPQLLEGETAALFVDDIRIAATYDPQTGTLTPLRIIPDGEHRISFALLDRAGSETVRSPELVVKIKVAPPTTPAKALRTQGELPVMNEVAVTAEAQPRFEIEALSEGETPRLYANGELIAASWSPSDRSLAPLQSMSDGLHEFHYTLLDVAGNESSASPRLHLQVMAAQVNAPVRAPALLNPTSATAMAGDEPLDAQTCGNAPSFSIDVPPEGLTPSLLIDGVRVFASWYPATAALSPLLPLEPGIHRISYTLKNIVGRVSAGSPSLRVMVSPEPLRNDATAASAAKGGAVHLPDTAADPDDIAETLAEFPARLSISEPDEPPPALGGILETPLAAGEKLFVIMAGAWVQARVAGLNWAIELSEARKPCGPLSLIRQGAGGELGDCVVVPESAIQTFGVSTGSDSSTTTDHDPSGAHQSDAAEEASGSAVAPSSRLAKSGATIPSRRAGKAPVADVANDEASVRPGAALSGMNISASLGAYVGDADQIYLVSRGQWTAVQRSGSVWTAFDPDGHPGDWSYQLICVGDSGQVDTLPGVGDASGQATWIATRPVSADGHGVLAFIVETSSAATVARHLSLQIEPFESVIAMSLQIRSDGDWEKWYPDMRVVLESGQRSMRVELRSDGINASRLPSGLRLVAVPFEPLATDLASRFRAVTPGADDGRGVDHACAVARA